MKRFFCSFFLALLLLLAAGCSPSAETSRTPAEMAAAIQGSQTELPALKRLLPADTDFALWLSDYYGVAPAQVEDGVICYADGPEASEIVVLRLAEDAAPASVEAALRDYLQERASSFDGYAPQQAAMVRSGIVTVRGSYVALMICSDPSVADAAFASCFGKEAAGSTAASPSAASSLNYGAAPETPGSTDAPPAGYDPAAVVQAWKTGDASALSETDHSILQAAEEVLRQEITDGMSVYEKELAIHDWITGWSSFDMSAFSRAPGGGSATSDTPYGVLLQRSGNCWGYASTFQLFMELLDIECITVYGLPNGSGVQHVWNMVRLDGEWYCVDAAWDDPIGGGPTHTYFNVTSEFLRRGSIHRWEQAAVPEAAGTAYAYSSR